VVSSTSCVKVPEKMSSVEKVCMTKIAENEPDSKVSVTIEKLKP
jgi:hypothetical protein